MPNVFQSATSGLANLKNFYQGPMADQFNNDMPIYRGAEKGKESWSGLQVVRPLRVRRNNGIGATSDGGNLPAIGRQTMVQAIIAAKYNYLRFGITGVMIKASKSNDGSFERMAGYELQQGYEDLKSDCNRQLSWDGTGYLARLSAAAVATPTITVQGREGTTEEGDKFLDVGMIVDIVTAAGVYKAQGVTVNSIPTSGTTATLTLDQAVTAASGDYLIRSGSLNQEVQGLLYALDGASSTIYSVDRSSYPSYKGNVDDNSAGQLTLDAMQAVYNKGLRRGGAKYSACFTDYDSHRMYQKLLTADKRYVNTTKGDGGFAAKDQSFLEFNGIPIVPDKDMPRRFTWLDQSAIKKYVLAEMEFADETGSMYLAQTDVDAFEVRVRMFFNLFNEQPSKCAVLKNYISP